MNDTRIQQLFESYKRAFIDYDINGVIDCYHLPCTLNTPDKVALLVDQDDFQNEFSAIFKQLQDANTSNIIAQQASFQQVSEQVYLVCIDWDFIDEQGQVFADFTAIYHVLDVDKGLKIVNVASHDLSNSLTLAQTMTL